MPDRTRIVFIGGGDGLTVEEEPSTVRARLSRKGVRFMQLTKTAGSVAVTVAIDQVAYIQQVPESSTGAAFDARRT